MMKGFLFTPARAEGNMFNCKKREILRWKIFSYQVILHL